jgi:hypothetical protein
MQGDLTADIPKLRESFKAREVVNPEFDFIKEDFEHYQELKEDITISLSEAARKTEAEELEVRKKERKEKREALLAGQRNPLITPVKVVFNSEKEEVAEEDSEDDDEEENTENDSEPADDFVLKEAARIIAELAQFKHLKLIAKADQDKE